VKDLSTLHDRHLNRPTLDDSVDEERLIDEQTQEISQVLHLRMIRYNLLIPSLIREESNK